ncbi:hypothetical protein ZIOFF_010817 [Zingiber officinale]|uniref:Uncharacterized protein n=1 Tax=Zingiber officinale TaxID=94328 RepID=A0A8J5LPL6_ZINOF|nr:hypothetical protein ZIOFF_010817 [Zingiber officinale]
MPSVYQRLARIIRCSLGSPGECFLYVCLWDQFTLDSRKIMVSPLLLLSNNQASRCLPLSQCDSTVEARTVEEKERWWKRGLKAISEEKLAVVLLSGGQALAFISILL